MEGQFSLLESGLVFGLAPFPGAAAAIPFGGFFPSAAHWDCGSAGRHRALLALGCRCAQEMRCVDIPKSSPSSSGAGVSTQLLSVMCGDRPHHCRVQEDSNAVHAGGKWRFGHVELAPRSAAARAMCQGSPNTVLECATPPEVSGYFRFVAEELHFAILTVQPSPEVPGCFQFVMLLFIEPSTLALKKKSISPYTSYSFLKERIPTHPGADL